MRLDSGCGLYFRYRLPLHVLHSTRCGDDEPRKWLERKEKLARLKRALVWHDSGLVYQRPTAMPVEEFEVYLDVTPDVGIQQLRPFSLS